MCNSLFFFPLCVPSAILGCELDCSHVMEFVLQVYCNNLCATETTFYLDAADDENMAEIYLC